MNPNFDLFIQQINRPYKFNLFLLKLLPSAYFAGLGVHSFTPEQATISVKEKWFNKNPFRSVYFAILSMAAEVSTGALCWGAIYKRNPAVSMLLVKVDGSFYKKATGKILFTCADGDAVNKVVDEAINTGTGTTVTCHSTGRNEAGEMVAEFNFTWSFKARSK